MKVAESNQNTVDYNKGLDDKLRKLSKSKEEEIERVKEIYDKKVDGAKIEGEDRYAASIKHNHEMIASIDALYEEKLKSYRDSLENTQKNLARSESAFNGFREEKMKNLKEQFAGNIDEEFQRAKENQNSVQNSMKQAVQNIQDKSRIEQTRLEAEASAHMNAQGVQYNQKVANEERDYRARFDADKIKHEDDLKNQKTELKAVLDKDMQKGKQLETEKLQVQKEELSYLDNHQRDMIAQRNADFKIRYQKIVEEHEAILNDIKAHLEHDMKKMLESTSTQKKMLTDKLSDSFYRVETLNPTTAETEKDLTVSLKVPEYEKENVHLSVHGRDIKLTLSRKYTDSMDAQDGSLNKSTRNELFSKEFSTKDILSPKQISQKYENGVLSYKIQKA